MNWHKGGMTERIANAMLAGSVCVTDKTSYLEKILRMEKILSFFHWKIYTVCLKKIKNLLADIDTAAKFAAKGKRKCVEPPYMA